MGSALDQFDARHLRAVTLAVAGLEDARVAAPARGEPGTQLLEELVRGRALVDVNAGETARVQRAGAGLRDQLLDERTQFLRLRLGRLDGSLEDERGREVPKERELLLGRAAELPSCLLVAHGLFLWDVVGRLGGRAAGRGAPVGHAYAIAVLFETHAEIQSFALEQVGDFLERLLAEVLHFEDLVFRLAHEITERTDARVLERVHGAYRELEVVDRRLQQERESRRIRADELTAADRGGGVRAEPDEVLEVRLGQRGGVADRLLRRHRAVRLDREDEAIVVRALSDARFRDGEVHA